MQQSVRDDAALGQGSWLDLCSCVTRVNDKALAEQQAREAAELRAKSTEKKFDDRSLKGLEQWKAIMESGQRLLARALLQAIYYACA